MPNSPWPEERAEAQSAQRKDSAKNAQSCGFAAGQSPQRGTSLIFSFLCALRVSARYAVLLIPEKTFLPRRVRRAPSFENENLNLLFFVLFVSFVVESGLRLAAL